MNTIDTTITGGIATLTLSRGKVNALESELAADLKQSLDRVTGDENIRAIILTGKGKFFSFGFDLPVLLGYSRNFLIDFLHTFSRLKRLMYLCPKPLIAAINGHAVAGGCMLILPADYRMASSGRTRIGLNEINIGASVFVESIEMLKATVGTRNTQTILLEGTMYSVDEAKQFGLIDEIVEPDDLMHLAKQKAESLGAKSPEAFRAIKELVRGPIAKRMEDSEDASIAQFVEVWFSKGTQKQLRAVEIRS